MSQGRAWLRLVRVRPSGRNRGRPDRDGDPTQRRQRHRQADEAMVDRLLEAGRAAIQGAGLANQLNPHFLFNSLNNIRFLIHENPDRAEGMVIALSEILRYSLECGRHEKVRLETELEILQKYVAIAQIQLEDRLDFVLDIPPGLDAYLVPPMVLQMLVENAIKHGLEKMRAGGNVRVAALDSGGTPVFQVGNDMPTGAGQGGPSAQAGAARMEGGMDSGKDSGKDSGMGIQAGTGIGLQNIGSRLRLLYGGRAAVEAGQPVAGPAGAATTASQPELEINSRIFVKDGEHCHLVRLDSIRIIESCKNYVLIFFGDKKAYVKKSMNSVEERLPKKHFFRISRQHIVDLQAISAIAESVHYGYDITMDDGTVLEVSRRNAAELKTLLSF